MKMTALATKISDGIARLELNVPGETVNTISSSVRRELESVLDDLKTDSVVRAVVLISGKQDNFIAGADIDEFVALKTRDQALGLVQDGQALVERLDTLGKPIVAAIHGACLGGGLEAVLACTYRIATEHPKTQLGLPEVRLGIIPAAGGCQRLPRLIGLRAALDIILAGRTLGAKQALRRGVVDELVHPAILEAVAFKVARRLADGWRPKRRKGGLAGQLMDRNPLGQRLVFSRARKKIRMKIRGHYPAPLAAIEAVQHGLSYGLTAGLDCEAAHFAELSVGDVSRNLVQIFFATTALKKDPGVSGDVPTAKPVENLAVIGAGFMGSAIAGVAAAKGEVDVRLRDTGLEAVARGLENAHNSIKARLARKRIAVLDQHRIRDLLSGGTDWSGFRRTDLVIEAVFEDLEVKRKVFRAVEDEVKPDCIIASNTSTIPIGRIAEVTKRPQQVVGMHFFSPVDKMPLVEVILTDRTAPWVTVSAVAFGRAMGKTTIVVRDRPGFWVNRILAPYLIESTQMLREGVPIEKLDETMAAFGFPVGPIALMDEIGLDVALKGAAVLHDAFGDRMMPMDGIGAMTERGRLGRKSGRGFYIYGRGKKKVDPAIYDIVGRAPDRAVPDDDVTLRLTYAMLNEAARALDEGVVRSARDGDIGAVLGVGFPGFRGGPFRYLDSVGSAKAVETLEELALKYGSRFQPATCLRNMAERNGQYYE
ncbi:MAG: enoyl-CoA hydratase/isomerase family protein [Gemmatimonadota bacterium]|nr:MAG: enoyl-CoA hydratase/isomerase family protein [Gemmatimonadota bacterium]